MNVEQLESFIANEDAAGLAKAVAKLKESEREKLSKASTEILASLVRKPGDPGHSMRQNRSNMPERLRRHLTAANKKKKDGELTVMHSIAELAVPRSARRRRP